MANQRILDDSHEEGRTKDGASDLKAANLRNGTEDLLEEPTTEGTKEPISDGLDDISVDEWTTSDDLRGHNPESGSLATATDTLPSESSTSVSPTPRKRAPAWTLIFKSFSKSQVAEPSPSSELITNSVKTELAAGPAIRTHSLPSEAATSPEILTESLHSEPAPKPGTRATAPTLIFKSFTESQPEAPAANPELPVTTSESTEPSPTPKQVTRNRPVARTLILRSFSKDHTSEILPSAPLTSQTTSEPTAPSLNLTTSESQEPFVAPKPRMRANVPTLIFKAIPKSHLAIKKTILEKSQGSSKKSNPAALNDKAGSMLHRQSSDILLHRQSSDTAKTTLDSNRPDILTPSKRQEVDGLSNDDNKPLSLLQSVVEHRLFRSQVFKSTALFVILSTVLLFCFSALMKALRQDVSPAHVNANHDPHEYKSCDNHKSLRLSDKGSALAFYGKSTRGQFKNLTDDDFFTLIMAPPKQREFWFQRRDAGLVDQDGTILYPTGAPELALAKKMESYCNLVAAKYKETKLYPSDAAKLEKIAPKEFRYTNPFSGKVDQPIVLYKRFAAAEKSWTEKTQFGQMWSEEPAWKPGAIHCLCLDYCRFFIRGFDRDTHPLSGTLPGSSFYIELKDGVNLTPTQQGKTVEDNKDGGAASFYISNNPSMQMIVATMRQLVLIIFWLLILVPIALIAGHFIRKSKTTLVHQTKFKT